MQQDDLRILKYSILGIFGLFIFISFLLSTFIIDEGERGVVLKFGQIERVEGPGFHFKIPFVEGVEKMDVRAVKLETEATAASKDLQDVTTQLAVQYNLNAEAVTNIYSEYQSAKNLKINEIQPAIQDAIKAATSQFNASELITKRPEVKDVVENILRDRLAPFYVQVRNVDIVNFSFSESFSQAIEQKVTAEQDAQREENKLRQVQAEAAQRIEQAKAEAEAIRIQAQAVTQQGGKDYVQLQAIEKWNGQLPQQFVPGSAIPFLNLK